MPRTLHALCALLPLALAACAGNAPSRSFDADRPALEVRPGLPSQERGAKRFTFKGNPVYLGGPSYFDVRRAWSTTDDAGRPSVAFELTEEDTDRAREWVGQHVGEVAAILVDGNVLMTGIVQPPSDRPFVITARGSGYSEKELDFLVKLLNGGY